MEELALFEAKMMETSSPSSNSKEPAIEMPDLSGQVTVDYEQANRADIEVDPEDTGYPTIEPETLPDVRIDTDNLPAVANQSLMASGVQRPKWHKVANLPGNMNRGIRTLGKRLFYSFTNTPTDEITMIGNLGGMGPNTPLEINSVAGWLRNHGKDLGGVGNIDFNNINYKELYDKLLIEYNPLFAMTVAPTVVLPDTAKLVEIVARPVCASKPVVVIVLLAAPRVVLPCTVKLAVTS